MTQQLVDHEAEDRETRDRIRSSLDETLFVEAGAGTGKTSALVDRVVALVLGGRAIEKIVAITFTELAAAELRDRVRGDLEAAREGRPEHATLIEAALASLDRAQISTIHSFCQRLLYAFAAEAGIDPSFRVQDEVMAERRFQERWRVYLEALGEDEDAGRAIDRALGLGLSTWHMETLAVDLTKRPDLSALLDPGLPQPETVDWPDLEAMKSELKALPLEVAPADDKLRVRVERLASLVNELVRSRADRESTLAAGAEIVATRWNVSSRDVWGKETCDRVKEAASDIAARLAEILRACRSEALAGVLPVIVRFVIDDARQRGREGKLTFDDLILLVRDLLATNREAVRSLRTRFDVMLIDEFQDTDPLQVDIAMAFAKDPDRGEIEPGRLFLVGDPKQSIYRFRRADMAIYSKTKDDIESAKGAFPVLALNRRSRDVVLDWVNKVFDPLIGPGWEQDVQPKYQAVHPARSQSVLAGPGVAWIGSDEPVDGNARAVREIEAGAIAANCLAALDEGWQVTERDGTVRQARLSDIAVLIPSRGVLPALERAFSDAAIPYRVESGSLIYRTQEVRDLLNCLTAIDDPADEIAIVASLRSTAFACSDVELAEYKATGGRWNYLSPSLAEHEGRVGDSLRALADYHRARHESSLGSLVERFVADRSQVEIGMLDAGNRNSFRRARFVVEQARAFEAIEPASLRAFVNWMESRAGEAILDNEGAGLDDDEDAVRILTIHGAKGLEFPIVFVAGLGSAPLNRPGTYLVDRATGEIAVCIGSKYANRSFELGPVEGLREQEKKHGEKEYDRLLYVATTRARDHLVVSLYHAKNAWSTCGAKRLLDHGAAANADRRSDLPREVKSTRRAFEDLVPETAEESSVEEFESARRALVKASITRSYTSATAIGKQKKEEKDERTDESEPWSRGRGGTRPGRAVHAAIQSLAWDADDPMIESFSRAQAVAEAIPHRSSDVERLVRWVLRESKAAARARSAKRALREVPFALQVDGVVLEGFIDLLIETNDGIELVDWKTDQVDANEVAARMQEYETQAGLYVYGIEAATGQRVNAVTYVFAGPGVEISPGDPAELSRAAAADLAGSFEVAS